MGVAAGTGGGAEVNKRKDAENAEGVEDVVG